MLTEIRGGGVENDAPPTYFRQNSPTGIGLTRPC